MAEKGLREAWAASFVKYPIKKNYGLIKLDEDGDIAAFVSGEIFKLDEEILCFDRVFHVWNGDQWVYCGKSEKEAQAAFLKLVRIRDTGCTNSRFVS